MPLKVKNPVFQNPRSTTSPLPNDGSIPKITANRYINNIPITNVGRETPKSEIINMILLILILLILLFSLSNFINLDTYSLKHWSTNKDDIVFPYNSLLYAQGLEQEHLDHPSLFTFLIFPIFYKIFYFFDFLSFYDLEGFNSQSNVDEALNKLFLFSRIIIFVFSSILIDF